MNPVKWTIVVFCLLSAAALIAADIRIASKTPPVEVKTTGAETRDGFPGSEIVTTLADKAPRLAAAFSFVLLAAITADILELSVGTTTE